MRAAGRGSPLLDHVRGAAQVGAGRLRLGDGKKSAVREVLDRLLPDDPARAE